MDLRTHTHTYTWPSKYTTYSLDLGYINHQQYYDYSLLLGDVIATCKDKSKLSKRVHRSTTSNFSLQSSCIIVIMIATIYRLKLSPLSLSYRVGKILKSIWCTLLNMHTTFDKAKIIDSNKCWATCKLRTTPFFSCYKHYLLLAITVIHYL